MSETYIYGNVGAANTQIGTNTLTSLTSGTDNTAFGDTVFANLTTGSGNSGFGTNVGSAIGSNPSFSTAMGYESLRDMTTAMYVSAYGYQSLVNLTTGKNNTAIGSGSGASITTAVDNALIGADADVVDSATFNATAIGFGSKSSSNSSVIGKGAQSLSTSSLTYNSVIGTDTVADASSVRSVIIGGSATVGTTIDSVVVGHSAAGGFIGNIVERGVIMGWSAFENIQDSFEDVVIGAEVGRNVAFSQRNVLMGVGANKTPVPVNTAISPLEYVVAIGYEAGLQNSTPGNVFVGVHSGMNTTTETEIVAIGFEAMKFTEAGFNTAIGKQAMLGIDTVSLGCANNVAVGDESLVAITTATDNVVVGTRAGTTITSGSNNVIMGHASNGSSTLADSVVMGSGANATANDSVVVGFGASSTIPGGIAIGHMASATAAGDVQLGDPAAVPATGTMNFRTQLVADESWVGNGTSDVMIDNDGNICRGFASTLLATFVGAGPFVLGTAYSVPANSARRIEALVTGRRTDATNMNDTFSVRIDGAVKNDGTTITLNSVEEVQIKDDAAWIATLVVVGSTVELQVGGVIGSTIDWAAEVREFLI